MSLKSIKMFGDYIIENTNNINTNFWKWFGDSKVISDNKPTVCYHGTSYKDIKSFNYEMIGLTTGNDGHYGYGMYFSYAKNEAKIYGDYIYECYIKIEKPFTGTFENIKELKKIGVENIDDIINTSIDFGSLKNNFLGKNDIAIKFLSYIENNNIKKAWEYVFNNNGDSDFYNDLNDIIEYTTLKKHNGVIPDYVIDFLDNNNINVIFEEGFANEQTLHWITDLGNDSKKVTDSIISLGYDGVIYGSEVVPFYSNQIKSVQNLGNWDLNNNNIYL
jgi:hypothetical protein